jgi:hypothetical protein
MNQLRNKPLLSDILSEDTDSEFREALLDQTLRIVRRKRRFRKARQAAFVTVMAAGLILISFHFPLSKPPASKIAKRIAPPYLVVTTQPLSSDAVLSTSPDHSIRIISSSPTVQLVATSENTDILHRLDDDELLTLLPSPALLVRRGPHLAELVFANADAQSPIPPN